MKKHMTLILTAIAVVILLVFAGFSIAGWVQARALRADPPLNVPSMVSYQGHIYDEEKPFDGDGYFQFAIVDGSSEPLWSNDGDYPPKASVPLKVSIGLFSVLLGDTTLTGMSQALTPELFKGPESYLQVWFSPDNGSFTQMPDQAIASVPYALQAYYAVLAEDASTFDGKLASAYQLRVSGTCPVGSAVRVINTNGSVVCEPVGEDPQFTLSTVDASGDVGRYSSIAIGTDGLGLISYIDYDTFDLKVAHCNDVFCSSTTTSLVNSDGAQKFYTSLAIGTDGYGLISFWDATNYYLKVAHCENTTCTSSTTYTLDDSGVVAGDTSIAIGGDGLGMISYYDYTNGYLKYAHCDNTACTGATTRNLDVSIDVGASSSITVKPNGFALISYYDATNGDLKILTCSDALCSSVSPRTLDADDDVGNYSSITIVGLDGYGLISYYDATHGALKVAYCNGNSCTSATISMLDDTANVGFMTSITTGADGAGIIAYHDNTNYDLKIAHCKNTACTEADIYSLDFDGAMGYTPSIAIGSDGLPLISYYDATNDDLKVAHCSNELCIPIFLEEVP